MRYKYLFGYGLYCTTEGDNVNRTMSINYYTVDCYGSLVFIDKYTKAWTFS